MPNKTSRGAPGPASQRSCIFCKNTPVSKEHIFSTWTHAILPREKSTSYIEERHQTEAKIYRKIGKKERYGDIVTKKIRAVCKNCNNEWMSEIEKRVKPILTSIMRGEFFVLNKDHQHLLALWVTLKSIVAEHNQKENVVTPFEDRFRLMMYGEIPPYYNIYAARCPTEKSPWFRNHMALLTMPYRDFSPPLNGLSKNVKQVTMCLGSTIFHINAARVDEFRVEDRLDPSLHSGIRIWPIERSSFEWSASRKLSEDDLVRLGSSLDILLGHPSVLWRAYP